MNNNLSTEKYEYLPNSRKKFSEQYIDEKGKKVDKKIFTINEENFSGDLYCYDFIEINDKMFVGNNKCIIDINYKWLEFYDYNSKVKLTAIYDENNTIIEWYFDIARKIGKENGIPYEDDLYLDVVVTPTGKIKLLDEDELKEALNKMQITELEYENAYKEANQLIDRLKNKKDELENFTNKYLNLMK